MRSTSEPERSINILGDTALSMCLILYMSKYDNTCQNTTYSREIE